MNFKPAAAWLPLVLLSLSGAARADLAPYSVGASERVRHDDNVFHTSTNAQSDWVSITELNAGLDQTLGRDRLTANAAVNYSDYRHEHSRNATGYRADVNFGWETIGDLSGSLGASSNRSTYVYGITEDVPGAGLVTTSGRNLETTNSANASIQLGGLARWTIYASGNVSNRNYSADAYKGNELRQWNGSVGTRYSTSPDLSFGIVGSYTHGDYPNYATGRASFNSRTISATTRLQATGSSSFDAQVGYTTEDSDLLTSKRNYGSGNLGWSWDPQTHFKLRAGLARTTSGGVGSDTLASLNDRSLNTSANLDLTYALTAKISLAGDLAYIQRKYAGVRLPDDTTVNGTNHTTSVGLSVHYQPTRIADLSCGGTHESRSSSSGTSFTNVIPNYTDTTYQCAASVTFN